MKIGQSTITAVQERAEIDEVVGDYVSLKKKGQNLWACCPFHNEKSPSFSVAPNMGIYKCFGCGKAGDAIQFVMDIEGIGFAEAIKQLAQKYGIEIEEQQSSPEEALIQTEKESLFIVMNYAKDFFVRNLWEDEEGKSIGYTYFKERGLSDELIKRFELGYSFSQWDGLLKQAIKDQYNEELLEKAGLLIVKEDKKYDRFRARVMFPIHNVSGKTIAFGARILGNHKDQPKYINSPETEIYHKSDVLYGISQAKNAIRNQDNCYLVEGYTDVISLHQSGVENVVASSGTSLTENQIRLIGRFTQNITVLFDGDAAGLKAAMRGIDMILEAGLNVKVVTFPEGEDPDSFAQKNSNEQLLDYLEKSVDFIVFKTQLLAKEHAHDPIKKADTIRDIIQSVAKIPDPVKRSVYLKECSEMLEMDEQVLISELNKFILQDKKSKKQVGDRDHQQLKNVLDKEQFLAKETNFKIEDTLKLQEKESIRLLLNYGDLPISDDALVVNYVFDELEDIHFTHPLYKQMLAEIKEGLQEGEWRGRNYFLKQPDEELRKLVFELATDRYELSKNWEIKFQIYTLHEREVLNDSAFTNILRLKHRAVLKMIDELRTELKGISDESDLAIVLSKIQQLNELKKEYGELLGMVVVR